MGDVVRCVDVTNDWSRIGGCHLLAQCTESVPYFTEKAFIFAVANHAVKFEMLLVHVWGHVSFCSGTISTCGL